MLLCPGNSLHRTVGRMLFLNAMRRWMRDCTID
jgi:hypothetical protein